MMKVFLPYRAEFGYICIAHAPQVYAEKGRKAVIIEQGLEALYPDCEFAYVSTKNDDDRRVRIEVSYLLELQSTFQKALARDFGTFEYVMPDLKAERAYFIPRPYVQHVTGIPGNIDVVVCPRKREYGSDKNWHYWQELIDAYAKVGLIVFAAGHPTTSFPVKNCMTAWSGWNRNGKCLDNTIAAMLKAKVVVATDNGLAHLALMCGKPLVLISHKDGLVADGFDDVGNSYWPIKMDIFERENHTDAPIHIVYDCWHSIKPILDYVKATI